MSKQMIDHSFALMKHRADPFSINLSPQDILDEKTLLLLESLIMEIDDPSRVGLEIVESEQIKDFSSMIEACNRFRALGANIIVDDFGSGYSNIDEIIKLEPSVIKLDGSLIKSIDVDAKQRKIASQLIRLCKVFEAKTVAEFVHNEEVCKIATDIGADFLQGFYLGEPAQL
jgi:EAL domain-containing protein (putative c-di-GMP-specific phosphodiesterase class I)